MSEVNITIDGKSFLEDERLSVKKAALKNEIYVPGLCSHPDLDPFNAFTWSETVWQGQDKYTDDKSLSESDEFPHCELCLISINDGPPQRACTARIEEGMVVTTGSAAITDARRESLKKLLAHHPHACLTCAQKEGCDRVQCSMNVPVHDRCCELLGRCEIGKVADYIGIPTDTPAYVPFSKPELLNEPLFIRDYELCIGCTRCIRVCRDVREVDILGAVAYDNRVVVGSVGGPTLIESLCRFCGACVDVCPTGALRDQPDQKPLIDDKAPCVAGCPLGIDIPGYLDAIVRSAETEALELIRQKAALPGVLGYACFHPCESNCRRNALDQSASICTLKRYVSDVAGDLPVNLNKLPSTGKSVAVIGGGPAGLAAAVDLLRWGHDVTIFDDHAELGGMLRQAIPSFRLPKEVIDRDLKYIYDLGLKTELNQQFGKDFSVDDLTERGYNATVLAVGLPDPLVLEVEGLDLKGINLGLDFLREAKGKNPPAVPRNVIVIGGGSVAVDAARTARRLGAENVGMVCLEDEDEMPASPDELVFAFEEDITIRHRWGVLQFEGEGGKIERVLLQRCVSVFDRPGRFNPQFDPMETCTLQAEMVIVAIGQKSSIELKPYLDNTEGVFLTGDAATGPGTIVEAMANGRVSAEAVDDYLGGFREREVESVQFQSQQNIGKDENFLTRKRVNPEQTPSKERMLTLSIFEKTLSREQAIQEAGRCLRCNLRANLSKVPLPPDKWAVFSLETLDEIPAVEGVIVFVNEEKVTQKIIGTADMRAEVEDLLSSGYQAAYLRWELDPMYTKRESELMQAHLQEHGEMPDDDELDDLF